MVRSASLGLLRLVAIMLLAGLMGATLLRIAPGFGSDEQQFNASLSSQSLQALRQARLTDSDVPSYYGRYLVSLLRGDLGVSHSLNQPVRDLLRDRLPATLRGLAVALSAAWLLGLLLAAGAQLFRSPLFRFLANGMSGVFLSTPAAVLALLFVVLRFSPFLAAALLVFPKIYRYTFNLLQESYELPHVLMARAKGAGTWRVLLWHVLPAALPQLLALAGVSISMTLGVILPIEVICDVPGIGQLAWQAAQSRDLPLLVNLTLVVTLLTVCATMLSDQARRSFTRSTV
ncbi:MAG TPA: ABC transporter permease subunit [Candidatus Saccharimonadales bacterium]|nr:ABC transporter permease subunit [Candidatus Saccharimonadales bacterium]